MKRAVIAATAEPTVHVYDFNQSEVIAALCELANEDEPDAHVELLPGLPRVWRLTVEQRLPLPVESYLRDQARHAEAVERAEAERAAGVAP